MVRASARAVVALKNSVPSSWIALLHQSMLGARTGRDDPHSCKVAAAVNSNEPTKKTTASVCAADRCRERWKRSHQEARGTSREEHRPSTTTRGEGAHSRCAPCLAVAARDDDASSTLEDDDPWAHFLSSLPCTVACR